MQAAVGRDEVGSAAEDRDMSIERRIQKVMSAGRLGWTSYAVMICGSLS
jgi:hypothetical protein